MNGVLEVRELPLVRTFAQPDDVVKVISTVPRKWQVNEEKWGIRLVYEPREYAEGKGLLLLGELHELAGVKYLVRYGGDTREALEDWWKPHDETWIPSTMTDKEAEWLRFKLWRDKVLKNTPELRKMMNLVNRARKGSKTAILELGSVSIERLEWFREWVRALNLSVEFLVWTCPRKVRRLRKKLSEVDER